MSVFLNRGPGYSIQFCEFHIQKEGVGVFHIEHSLLILGSITWLTVGRVVDLQTQVDICDPSPAGNILLNY
jgi:hypothetical protein